MDINCTYDCLYQINGKCCLTTVPTNFTSEATTGTAFRHLPSQYTSHYDGDCPYRTFSTSGTFKSAILAFS